MAVPTRDRIVMQILSRRLSHDSSSMRRNVTAFTVIAAAHTLGTKLTSVNMLVLIKKLMFAGISIDTRESFKIYICSGVRTAMCVLAIFSILTW